MGNWSLVCVCRDCILLVLRVLESCNEVIYQCYLLHKWVGLGPLSSYGLGVAAALLHVKGPCQLEGVVIEEFFIQVHFLVCYELTIVGVCFHAVIVVGFCVQRHLARLIGLKDD